MHGVDVPLVGDFHFNGHTLLREFPETADVLAKYDTLEIEVEMRCPDPEKPEPGNCGAWDYIAWLAVRDENGKNHAGAVMIFRMASTEEAEKLAKQEPNAREKQRIPEVWPWQRVWFEE